jgi:hypothetical protein
MKVKIEYIDNSSFTVQEIVANAKARFGDAAVISAMPDSTDSFSLMYFAIQELITQEQLEAYFHEASLYDQKCRGLVDKVIELATEATIRVLRDNECRLE